MESGCQQAPPSGNPAGMAPKVPQVFTCNPGISLLSTEPKAVKTCAHQKPHAGMFPQLCRSEPVPEGDSPGFSQAGGQTPRGNPRALERCAATTWMC